MNLPKPSLGFLRIFPALLALLGTLLLLPRTASAQSLTLANPHWNITLTDAGYSDFLLDNTPGFEGREYLSGEWGAAVAYQVAGQAATPPQWLERNFSFPDWITDSQFSVVAPIAQTGLNADNLPIAQSVIANGSVQVTLRHEMLDTIVGTPMGALPASTAGAGASITSSRYVLKQTATIKNISGAAISGLQLFQFVHGLHSQRGVYDNRAYAGPLGDFRYDVTLAGVDPYSIGTNSSSAGLEDFLGFHANVAPSAYEIGRYGIEGNGLDDHCIGKPSDGVHLSIEDNWQNPPYSTRLGTDNFAPAERWVSGAERWNLGSLAAGQSVSLDVILSLRTGTQVVPGTNSTGGCNGGSGVPGGEDYNFDDVTSPGSCFGEYSKADANEISVRIAQGEFDVFTFLPPGGPQQLWKLQFSGTYVGAVNLTFGYDATILPPGLDQAGLAIYQFDGVTWQKLATTVDPVGHTLRVSTTNLSTFALGVDNGISYTVNGSESPVGSGTITGGGTFADGASATLIAAANAGYVFTNWTQGATVVSASPSYSFIVHADRTLVANFASVGANKAITTSALPPEGGTTSGDGAYALGSSATVIARANSGYKFSKWLVNGAQVSTSRTNTFTVTGDRALVAKFKPVYSVSVSAEPANAGAVEADPTYEPGDLAKLKAQPNSGYCFVNWTQNGTQVSTDPNYQFNVTGNRVLVGHFAYGRMISATGYPGLGGTVTGGGVYQNGNPVHLVAASKPGYALLDWTENGNQVSTSESYTFTCTVSRALIANFVAGNPGLSVAVSASPVAGGTVSGGGIFTNGASANVTASANGGYEFVNWTEGGLEVSTAANYLFTVTNSRALVANFSPVSVNPVITVITAPFAGGTIIGDGMYLVGDWVNLSATSQPGYAFVNWTDHGTPVSSWPWYSFLAETNRTLAANFALEVSLDVSSFDVMAGTAGGSGLFPLGATVGVSAAPRTGFAFSHWTENDAPVSFDANYVFTLSASHALVAHFTPDGTSITFDFDSAMPTLAGFQPTPLDQTVGAITASFSSSSDPAFEVASDAGNGYFFTKFSGNYLASSVSGSSLEIRFNHSVRSISLSFATLDYLDLITPSTLQLEAFLDSTNALVGSATGSGKVNLSEYPPVSGRLNFQSATPFNLVRLSLPPTPNGAMDFMVDNITVVAPTASGLLELESFAGPARDGSGVVLVTFAATDAGGAVLATWDLPLSFSGGLANYTLDNVPANTAQLSAKTAWHLRRRLPVTFADGLAFADFADAAKLRAGDLDGNNVVDIVDYFILAGAWYTTNPNADLNGSGLVDIEDYFLLGSHWEQIGDPE